MEKKENELYEVIERLTEERDYYRTKCAKLQEMLDRLEKMYLFNGDTKAETIKIDDKWNVLSEDESKKYYENITLC